MTNGSITPRILVLDDDSADSDLPPSTTQRARRGFDYAQLLRQARERSERDALREALRGHARRTRNGDKHAAAAGDDADFDLDAARMPPTPDEVQERDRADEYGDDDDDSSMDEHTPARESLPAARARRIDAQTQPFVAALGVEQLRVVELMRFVAAHVADFCSERAILESGNWTIRLKLDAALLPECELELQLSHLDVVLRFYTDATSTRQLICRHVHVLREQLVNLLRRLAVDRDVVIESP